MCCVVIYSGMSTTIPFAIDVVSPLNLATRRNKAAPARLVSMSRASAVFTETRRNYRLMIASVALLLTPPYAAVILTLVFLFEAVVTTLNVTELAPAGTVTLGGTLARVELLLARFTTAPPVGAALVRFTVPVEVEPPTTVDGLSVRDESAAGAGAFTVSAADLLTPAYVAVMFPALVALTEVVFTVKLIDEVFAGTRTELGTVAAGLALDKLTSAPPDGAGPVKLTVPIVVCPPVTVEGFKPSAFKLAWAVGAEL